MSIQLFKTLVAIADGGSFIAAAARVHVTQAAVGQQMRRLEEQLQVALFDRSGKSPRLNHVGISLVPKARAVVQAYEAVVTDTRGAAQIIGEITFGAVPSTIRALVPLAIKRLFADEPGLHIRVVPGLSDELQQQVLRGGLDAALISQPAAVNPNVQFHPLANEPLVLLSSQGVTGNDATEIIQKTPYIRHARHSTVGVLADEYLIQNRLIVQEFMEIDSSETVISMVAHGLGVSIVPDLCVPDPIYAGLRKFPLGPRSGSRVLGLIARRDGKKQPLLDRLRTEMSGLIGAYQNNTDID